MKKQRNLQNITFAGVFLALAYVLPFLTGQIQEIGQMLCPMHIPVLLCGFICGAPWGAVVGFIAPLLRSLTLGAPALFPKAVAMAFELLTYGLMTGLMYKVFPKKKGYIYCSLVLAMLVGRLIWGLVQFACVGLNASEFSFSMFWAGSVANAIPGIILQLVFVPVVVMIFEKTKKSE